MSETPLLGFAIDPTHALSLFEQIYEALRTRVTSGKLASGDRLPPTRKLAQELGVSRTTIVTAYDQLIAEGFAHAKAGSGVYVSDIGEIELVTRPAQSPPALKQQEIRPKQHAPFSPGQPDNRLFPYRAWAKCVSRVARTDPTALIRSQDAFGDRELRTEICRYLADWRGVRATPSQVLMTSGAGDALQMCIRTLMGADDLLALEAPSYPPLRAFVQSLNLSVTDLEMDRNGGLPPTSSTPSDRPKLAILTPSSQFPLGGAMPQARRTAFLNWAAQTGGWIIEDDYDSEFRYAGRSIMSLTGLDTQDRALYIGTFSKIFSDSLRLGFVVLPPALIDVFRGTLERYGARASLMPQRPLAEFMKSGEYYRHIRRVRRIYAERRVTFVDALKASFGDLVSFEDHRAGMHIAVMLPKTYKDTEIVAQAEQQGLGCRALSTYFASEPKQNGLLMGFCSHTNEELVNAMARLRKIVTSITV